MRTNPKNYMEELVVNYYNDVAPRAGVCTCDVCTKDILSYTLNQLSAKYVTSEEGKDYAETSCYDPQFETKIMGALNKAIETVGKNPRHE